jgi:lycopene beta-cyclase
MIESAMNTSNSTFDFLFIGLGAANCLLILSLHENGLLKGKSISIVEPTKKDTNDRTFCFWATEEELIRLNLKSLVSYSWNCIEISGVTKQEINPLQYFHVKGIDLYTQTKNILGEHKVTFFSSFVTENPKIGSAHYEIQFANETICAKQVFDGRPPSYLAPQKNQSHLLQSFFGWKIKTTSKSFDTSKMVMMDFNVPQNKFTQFVYVLPYTDDTALIELTRFGDQKLAYDEAQVILAEYTKVLGVSFEILEEEQGVIPMSSAKIKTEDFGKNWVYMGAKANMLKSTTGYAFHAMAEDALIQTEAIRNKQLSTRKSRPQRFLYYDRLLLNILNEKPEFGKVIFETLFKKIPVTRVLSFLREKTNIKQEVQIFSKLPIRIFIEAAIKDLIKNPISIPVLVWPFLFTLLSICLAFTNREFITWGILAVGFLSVGLSHGALDHLTSKKIYNKKQLAYYVASYLLKGALLGLVWLILPDLALLVFIVYSAWHFGQADFKEWNLTQGLQSFIWGIVILMSILFFHFEELNAVLEQIPNLQIVELLKKVSAFQLLLFQIIIIGSGIIIAAINKSKNILLTLLYLLISAGLPLLVSFGIYFVGQHSLNGWLHLIKGLNERSTSLYIKSLPFSLGGAGIFIFFLLFAGQNYFGLFFIILSCLSIPHVFSMHHFYSRLN